LAGEEPLLIGRVAPPEAKKILFGTQVPRLREVINDFALLSAGQPGCPD